MTIAWKGADRVSIWVPLAVMALVAVLFVAWPLYSRQKRVTVTMVLSIAAIAALSAGLYVRQGSPDLPSGGPVDTHTLDEMIVALAARLEDNPDDLAGWKMLGRSYMSVRNYAAAADAYDRAVKLESSQNAETLVELGEAILARDNSRIEGQTSALFESALAIEPNNATALFYGGIGAFNRGNKELAADRWEILLGLSPPPEIEQLLRQRIAEWRGEPPAAIVGAAPPTPEDRSDVIVSAAVSVSAAAAQALPSDAVVFVIARDPGQPSPPIAVSRRRLSEFPVTIDLGDRDSMVAGRELSGFAEIELIARVSLSGQPTQQSGDWFGVQRIRPAESSSVVLVIDEQVP
jgi:cytochrome c-type biogenesis protein CcmH